MTKIWKKSKASAAPISHLINFFYKYKYFSFKNLIKKINSYDSVNILNFIKNIVYASRKVLDLNIILCFLKSRILTDYVFDPLKITEKTVKFVKIFSN